jgi:hypothetical protein
MPLHVSAVFTRDVTAGVAVALVGALLALAVSIWWERDRARSRGRRPPLALRVSCAFALGLFSLGMFWQLVGYLHLEYTTWWTW